MFGTNEKPMGKISTTRSDQVNGLLDKGCCFEGKLTFDGTVQINGDFNGEIYSDGTLIIGNDAKVNAKIYVDTLVTYGKVEGDIEAKSKIEMHVPAVIIANVKTKTLSIEDGVVFEGQCRMDVAGAKRAQPQASEEYETRRDIEENEEDVLVM